MDSLDVVQKDQVRRPKLRHAVLRALNGAGLGTVLGAVLGALLGAGFAAIFLPGPPGPNRAVESATIGAVYGVIPGAFAGFWIGMTAICRSALWGVLLGTAVGTGIGVAYLTLLGGLTSIGDGSVGSSILASGVIGGLMLSLLVRVIRARFKWWTRWEQ